MKLCPRLKFVFRGICKGLRVRALSKVLTFAILENILTPNFADYFFAYVTKVLNFTPLQIVILFIIGFTVALVFIAGYLLMCKEIEIRIMFAIAIFINVVSNFATYGQLAGWFDEYNQFVVVLFGEAAVSAMYAVLTAVPAQVAITRLIQNNIETSMFSLQSGLLQFTNLFWSKILGNIINLFYGVDNENLQDL